MVKNITGGNKQKGQARKFSTGSRQVSKLRVVEEEGEIYAQVTSMLGNGMCYVVSDDCITRLCVIRGKFRGRGKRDNILKKGSWILIGIREWDTSDRTGSKAQKCDLLEVYTEFDKDRLKSTIGPWKQFIANDLMYNNVKEEEFDFIDDKTEEYKKIMEEEFVGENKSILKLYKDEDEINLEDI